MGTVMKVIIRKPEAENLKVRAKGGGKLFQSLRSSLEEERKRRVTVKRRKNKRETLMKSSRTCYLKLKMRWVQKMCKWLRKPERRRKERQRLKLAIKTGRKERRRKTSQLTSLNIKSFVRCVNREERSSYATPVPRPTISAVWTLSWTRLQKGSGAVLLVRRMVLLMLRKTRMTSTWRCAGLARKVENFCAVTRVPTATTCVVLTLL